MLVQEPLRSDELRAGETVLIVDDESIIRTVIRFALSSYGYRVLEAASGAEALRLALIEEPVDLVISDVGMPGMSGPQFVAKFSELRPEAKVIFISGNGDEASVQAMLGGRDAVFIPKPFSPAVLAAAVRGLLDGTHRACSTPPANT